MSKIHELQVAVDNLDYNLCYKSYPYGTFIRILKARMSLVIQLQKLGVKYHGQSYDGKWE